MRKYIESALYFVMAALWGMMSVGHFGRHEMFLAIASVVAAVASATVSVMMAVDLRIERRDKKNFKKVLVVVDMQNDFITGSLGTKEATGIVECVKDKITEYKKKGYAVFFTRDTHGEDYLSTPEGKQLPVKHCIKGTPGWEIADGLDTSKSIIINKSTFGTFKWSYFFEDSDDLEIEVVGLCADICVVSNALILKAMFPSATIRVDSSACAGVTPESHEAALTTMKMCQIEVVGG